MNKKTITVVIATKSEDKINGIKEALLDYYPADQYTMQIFFGGTESNVSDQPFGNETYQGAVNRVNNIKNQMDEQLKSKGISVDYYIGCEAGIDNTNAVVVNGKVVPLYASEQVVCVHRTSDNEYYFGKSSSWTIPEKDITEITNTDLDKYLRNRGCTGLHDVGAGRYITRKDAVKEGTSAAIATALFMDRCRKYEQQEQER